MPQRNDDKVDLSALIGAVLRAVQEGKYLGDMESARLAESYARNRGLSDFTVPAFAVTEVDVEMRFAVKGVSKARGRRSGGAALQVSIQADALKGIDPQHVQVLRFRITPIALRIAEERKGR
jgi:hypothetical protein